MSEEVKSEAVNKIKELMASSKIMAMVKKLDKEDKKALALQFVGEVPSEEQITEVIQGMLEVEEIDANDIYLLIDSSTGYLKHVGTKDD